MPLNRANAMPTAADPRRYGMHENYDFYQDCRTRGRNRGLFTADQNVNGNDATRTRQNPNGNRNGLECPEERDYYPYWHPSPWRDIAIMTNKGTKFNPDGTAATATTRCQYYKSQSQNVVPKGECHPTDAQGNIIPPGPLAQTAKATIKPNNGARRWYNNNEKPAGAQANVPNNAACTGALFADSCWCAMNRGETVTWKESQFAYGWQAPAGGLAAPECVVSSLSRVNQLGNAAPTQDVLPPIARADGKIPQGTNANRYLWKVPAGIENKNCVLRLRYNISTSDYSAWQDDGTVSGNSLNAASNGRRRGNAGKSPIIQDPYVTLTNASVTGSTEEFLSLAVNTNQYARTFQDRSYVFEVRQRPNTEAKAAAQSGVNVATYRARVASNDPDIVQVIPDNKDLVNLNVRGKRGNIVQTYPSVEYDFVPNDLQLAEGDYVHFQWTGSDYNPRRGCNNGEGGPPDPPNDVNAARKNSRADRTNMVDMTSAAMNYPATLTGAESLKGTAAQAKVLFNVDNQGTPDLKMLRKLAYLDQTQSLATTIDANTGTAQACLTQAELNAINNKNQRENHPRNCAKLNAAVTPYFNAGAVQLKSKGKFAYFSSRNNNFSNRDQTGKICVGMSSGDCQKSDNPEVAATVDARSVAETNNRIGVDALIAPIIDAPTPEGFQEKDNDALGDGEAEGCEGRMEGGILGLSSAAVALISVGVVGAVAFVSFRVNRARSDSGADASFTTGRKKDPKTDKSWLTPSSAEKDVI